MYIVNFITIQPKSATSKNQDIEGNNKPSGLNNFPYHQQVINKVSTRYELFHGANSGTYSHTEKKTGSERQTEPTKSVF